YLLPDGSYERHPDNPGIRRFVWEHLCNAHRILHRLKRAGATVSAVKLRIAVPSAVILGQDCSFEGRRPESLAVEKVKTWP
ncbi:hypothetical protein CYLTODRAFT_328259, partial [Cylindrobasidium torrendii FP15055 ss-10]